MSWGVSVVDFGGLFWWCNGIMMLLNDACWCCILTICVGDVYYEVFWWRVFVMCSDGVCFGDVLQLRTNLHAHQDCEVSGVTYHNIAWHSLT